MRWDDYVKKGDRGIMRTVAHFQGKGHRKELMREWLLRLDKDGLSYGMKTMIAEMRENFQIVRGKSKS